MYCLNCGKQIEENVTHCPYCGMPVEKDFSQQNIPQQVAPRKGLIIAAKVFIIIGLVISALYVFTSITLLIILDSTVGEIIILIYMLIISILGVLFSIMALKQMSKKKPSVGICVCVLIFCNLIGGILLLCTEDSDYIKN